MKPTDTAGSLRTFIQRHERDIIDAFSTYARTLMPAGSAMTLRDLEDHCEELLQAVAHDLHRAQTAEEQFEKSLGRGTANMMRASGQRHADGRLQHGFGLVEVFGEFRALRASVLRLYEQTGQSDIVGIRRFNEAIDEALAESVTRYSAQRDLYRDQFIGILSHDLRGPLSAITAGAAFLSRAELADAAHRTAAATRILNSAQRMGRMIADLLDFTRMRLGGSIPIRTAPTALRPLCEEVLQEIALSHPDADVHFECDPEISGSWDADRLAQVVTNLAMNAIEHGAHEPVTLAARSDGEHVRLTVHNGGRPIPADVRERIFDPLVRGDASTSQHMGLGLFIAQAIVTAHGGNIDVASSEESGTTFAVRLPRDRAR